MQFSPTTQEAGQRLMAVVCMKHGDDAVLYLANLTAVLAAGVESEHNEATLEVMRLPGSEP